MNTITSIRSSWFSSTDPRLEDESPDYELVEDICPDCGGPVGPGCHPGHVPMTEEEMNETASALCADFIIVCDICHGSGRIQFSSVPSAMFIRCPCQEE